MKNIYRMDHQGSPYDYTTLEKTTLMVEEYFQHPAAQEFIARLRKVPAGSKILDLGSGKSMEANYLSQVLPQISVIAMDISAAGIHRNNREPKVAAVQADAVKIPFQASTLAGIHCKDMLVHIQNHPVLLKELSRVLKPGGFIYLVSARIIDTSLIHQYPWNVADLERYASAHGLDLIIRSEFSPSLDDWYGKSGTPRETMLFRKRMSLGEYFLQKIQSLRRKNA